MSAANSPLVEAEARLEETAGPRWRPSFRLPLPPTTLLLLPPGGCISTRTAFIGGSLPVKRGAAFRNSTIMRWAFGVSFLRQEVLYVD